MSKIDQKKYLKKYLSSGKLDSKSRKSSKDSYSGRSRVKIVDDDVDITKKNAGDEFDDLILTGEDAPQIVGIIDDRPPELRTIEDFKNSSKWKSLSKEHQSDAHPDARRRDDRPFRSDIDRNHKNGQFEKELNYSAAKRERRSRSNDLSPQRRKWGVPADKDASPVRRFRNDSNEGASQGKPWSVPTKRNFSPVRRTRDGSEDFSPTRKRTRPSAEKDSSPRRKGRNDSKDDNSPPRKTWNAQQTDRDYSPARRPRNDYKEVSPSRKYRFKDNHNTGDDAYCSMKRKDRSFPEQKFKRNPFRANNDKNTNISGTGVNNYNQHEQQDERVRSQQDFRLSSVEQDTRTYGNKTNIHNPFRVNAPKLEVNLSSRRESQNSGRNSSSDRSNPFRKKVVEASISTEDSLSRYRNINSTHDNFKQTYHQPTDTQINPNERTRKSTSTDDSFKHRYPRSELQYPSKMGSNDTSYVSPTKEVAKFNPFRNQSSKLNDNVRESKPFASSVDISPNKSRDYNRSSLKSEIIEPRNRQDNSYFADDVSKTNKPEMNKSSRTDNYNNASMRKPINTMKRIPQGEFSNERFNNRPFDNNKRFTGQQGERKIDQLQTVSRTDERKSSYFSTDSRNVYRKSRWDNGASRDTDLNPVRRRQNTDLSPLRSHRSRGSNERKNLSPAKGSTRRSRDRKSGANNYNMSVKNEKMKSTLDGKTAGLQDAKMLRQEVEAIKRKEDEQFNQLPAHISGKNADAVVREKRYVKGKDYEKDKVKEKEKAQRDEEKKRVYTRWGIGLKQIEDHQSKMSEEIHESNKPLARYSNDADLDELLKQQERLDDPMLEYMREKNRSKLSDGKILSVPKYAGPFPENRFNIRPGYRWDGVDRSSGYEKKWFDVQNQKKALQEEAYKYSTEDM